MMNIDDTNQCGIANVKKILIVSSGKGGVGKSTVATQLAMDLWRRGLRVGLLDLDLCGPSVPTLVSAANHSVKRSAESSVGGGWEPVVPCEGTEGRLVVMSLGFLLSKRETDSVVWRGPRKSAMVGSLLGEVQWGCLDCLVVDTPPGTSEEKISLCGLLKTSVATLATVSVVIVTSPQRVSLSDVRKDVTFFQKVNLPIIGLVENMSGLSCPQCGHLDRVFSTGGGEALALSRDLPFLGCLPLLPPLSSVMDSQQFSFTEKASQTLSLDSALSVVLDNIYNSLSLTTEATVLINKNIV